MAQIKFRALLSYTEVAEALPHIPTNLNLHKTLTKYLRKEFITSPAYVTSPRTPKSISEDLGFSTPTPKKPTYQTITERIPTDMPFNLLTPEEKNALFSSYILKDIAEWPPQLVEYARTEKQYDPETGMPITSHT